MTVMDTNVVSWLAQVDPGVRKNLGLHRFSRDGQAILVAREFGRFSEEFRS